MLPGLTKHTFHVTIRFVMHASSLEPPTLTRYLSPFDTETRFDGEVDWGALIAPSKKIQLPHFVTNRIRVWGSELRF